MLKQFVELVPWPFPLCIEALPVDQGTCVALSMTCWGWIPTQEQAKRGTIKNGELKLDHGHISVGRPLSVDSIDPSLHHLIDLTSRSTQAFAQVG